MMNRHFRQKPELSGTIAKILPHAKISFVCLAISSINSLHKQSEDIFTRLGGKPY